MTIACWAPSGLAQAKVKALATLPDIAWVIQQVGGARVEVESLLEGVEDPHYVDASPSYILKAANADMICSVGLDLEVGWLPKVTQKSGNARVQPGGKGFCELGRTVTVLEKPKGAVDRSMGDVHGSGNPHYWVSPKALAEGAKEVFETLVRVDPEGMATYQANYKKTVAELTKLIAEMKVILKQAATGGLPQVIEYHREFVYLFDLYGVKSVGSIEEKPGIPPSAGRIGTVSIQAKRAKVKLALAAQWSPKRELQKFSELSGVPVLRLPTTLKLKDGKVPSYLSHHRAVVNLLVQGIKGKPKAPVL